jgi:feruloyl esterase
MTTRKQRAWARIGTAGMQLLALGLMAVILGGGTSSARTGISLAGRASPLAAATTAPIAPKLDCAALAPIGTAPRAGVPDFTTIPGAPTRVTSAAVVAATATNPELCDVKGFVAPQVHFELKLPTRTWQGRYLQSGCGGFCGAVGSPSFPTCDLQPGGDFAVAATDDGHAAGGTDGLWGLNDQQLRVDFGTRAPHVLSLASRAIIKAFYGVSPRFSYFQGCSDGGREALMEAQRFPDDFNGIVAGAPANIWAPLLGESLVWNARANTDAHGDQILTADRLPALHDAVVKACDGLDGLVDGQIDDPRACRFDPVSLRCPSGVDQPTCLSPAQVETVRKLYQGPVDGAGRRLYPGGEPFGSELAWVPWVVTPPGFQSLDSGFGDSYLRYLGFPIGQPAASLHDWKFTVDGFNRLRAAGQLYNSANADLTAFRRHGGKLIIWHGWADPAIAPVGTTTYYDAVVDRAGGLQAAQQFARLFMIPTVYHCAGTYGTGTAVAADFVNPITHWVEQGAAPDQVVVTHTDQAGATVRTRPVFAYPRQAKYSGAGSIDEAANFVGVTPSPVPTDDVSWVGNDLFNAGGEDR